MACNIYEDPDLTMKVSYNKGARRKGCEREEKVVDIYESADTLTGPRLNPSRKGRGVRTQKRPPAVQRNSYKAAALILGLLCLLLLAGISVLLILYLPISLKSKQPNLSCQSQTKEKQNQSDTEWQEFRLSHFYYASAEKKNWTESRKDCQRRGGDLVIINSFEKQKFIERMKIHGDSWIGLQTSDDWNVKWKWVDGLEPRYRDVLILYSAWKLGVNTNPETESRGYTDQHGLWMHNKNGLKHWICEKKNY